MFFLFLFFFFSSRRRHTRWTGDWSSDVCSSDELRVRVVRCAAGAAGRRRAARRSVCEDRQRRRAHRARAGAYACMKLWPTGGLWRQPDFLKLWSAETVSQFGTQFTQLALPLVAIDVLHVSAFQVAALTVVEFLPFVLVSLPAGVWVDRLRRRPILVIGDLSRAVLLASVPVAYWLGALTMAQLYIVGFLVGIATVFFDVAYQSYLPSLVERQQLIDGNAKLEISRAAAQLGGPGIAGIVINFLRAPAALAFDALSFVGSAFFIFSIRKGEQPPKRDAASPRMREELRERLRYVLRHP